MTKLKSRARKLGSGLIFDPRHIPMHGTSNGGASAIGSMKHSIGMKQANHFASQLKSATVNGTRAVISPPLINPTNAPFGSVDFAITGKVVSAAVAPHKAMAAKQEIAREAE